MAASHPSFESRKDSSHPELGDTGGPGSCPLEDKGAHIGPHSSWVTVSYCVPIMGHRAKYFLHIFSFNPLNSSTMQV